MKRKIAYCVALTGLLLAALLPAQDEEKIQKLFLDAIEAMGGTAFLNVKDMVSSGNYFQFDRDSFNFSSSKCMPRVCSL